MRVACIILNYNDAHRTRILAEKLSGYGALDEIVIVDNASSDDSEQILRALETENGRIRVCRTRRNGGYGYGNNFGVRNAAERGATHALIVNPDVDFEEALVERLKQLFAANEQVGVASAIQRDIQGNEVARSAWRIPRKWRYIFSTEFLLKRWGENFFYTLEELHREAVQTVDCVAGSLLMVDVAAFLECGGYDEDIFLYCEETILGCKMKAQGYQTLICSDMTYDHLHGVTIQKAFSDAAKRKKLLLDSHRLVLQRYMGANRFALAVDRLVGAISVMELRIKSLAARSKRTR